MYYIHIIAPSSSPFSMLCKKKQALLQHLGGSLGAVTVATSLSHTIWLRGT